MSSATHSESATPRWGERVIRCQNCWRDRLERDVFYHCEDRAWYCVNTIACEYRYYIQGERQDDEAARQ